MINSDYEKTLLLMEEALNIIPTVFSYINDIIETYDPIKFPVVAGGAHDVSSEGGGDNGGVETGSC